MPVAPRRHQFALRFDRTVCRDCGRDAADAGFECKGAGKVRPRAAFRLKQPPRREEQVNQGQNVRPRGVAAVDRDVIALRPRPCDALGVAERDLRGAELIVEGDVVVELETVFHGNFLEYRVVNKEGKRAR
jgi:hypothetical protein